MRARLFIAMTVLLLGCNAGAADEKHDVCAGVTCTGHGTCAVAGSDAICACDPGYHASALHCLSDANPCDGVTCNGHGTCSASDGSATCTCAAGYQASGLDCYSVAKPCDGVSCTGHGTCTASTGVPTCACAAGYHACGLECLSDADPCDGVTCSGHGTCSASGGSAACTCAAGYQASGLDCLVSGPSGAIIPGKLEAEDYNEGGEGVAYHDTTPGNEGGMYRADGVDIDVDDGSGYCIGWIADGEWLDYGVNVTTTDTYDFTARVGSEATTGRFHLEVDGNNVTGSIVVPSSGGWQTFQMVSKKGLSLTAGEHTLKLVFDTGPFNIDYFIFSSSGASSVCGDGITQTGEECDGGACCTTSCTFASSATICRPKAGECDVADSCSGSSASCGTDAKAPNGSSCPGGTCQAGVCAGSGSSAGCGNASAPTGWRNMSVNVNGTNRTYLLYVPAAYNLSAPLPIVWVFHWMDGDGQSFRDYGMPFDTVSGNDAIVLYPDGLPQYNAYVNGQTGWDWNADDNNDLAMFDQVTADLESTYCVNPQRVFATGFSYGGHHGYTLACYRGAALRAVAPIAGKTFADISRCVSSSTSIMGMTGSQDYQADSYNGFMFFEGRMGCSSNPTPVSGLPCQEYPSCSGGLRAIWCGSYNEGHTIPQTWDSMTAIWSFFQSFQ